MKGIIDDSTIIVRQFDISLLITDRIARETRSPNKYNTWVILYNC